MMKRITISKALMQIEEMLKLPNIDYIMIDTENEAININVRVKIADLDESEALGDED